MRICRCIVAVSIKMNRSKDSWRYCLTATLHLLFLTLNICTIIFGVCLSVHSFYVSTKFDAAGADEYIEHKYVRLKFLLFFGMSISFISLIGVGSAKCQTKFCIGLFIVLVSVSLLAEGTFIIFCYAKDHSLTSNEKSVLNSHIVMPDPQKNFAEELQEIKDFHKQISYLIITIIISLQIVLLFLGCCLWFLASMCLEDPEEGYIPISSRPSSPLAKLLYRCFTKDKQGGESGQKSLFSAAPAFKERYAMLNTPNFRYGLEGTYGHRLDFPRSSRSAVYNISGREPNKILI